MKVGKAIELLSQYDPDVELLIHNDMGLQFNYEVIEIAAARDYLLTHLFDKSAEPPDEDAVYLIITATPGAGTVDETGE